MGKPFASIEKAIDILSLFNSEQNEISANEISDRLGMPLSTTYKYIDIFLKKGFLSKDPHSKKITLGLTIFKMGILAAEKISLINVAVPYMKSLVKQSGETVVLTVIDGLEALCVETIESSRMVRLTIKPGSTIPLHAGATSKVLLAYQDDAFIEHMIKIAGLKKLNKNTITDQQSLKKELELIRKQGFAFSDSEVDSGAAAISSPIFEHKGILKAGLSVAGPTERIKSKEYDKLIFVVCDTARMISNDLGYSMDRVA